jgi:hypothetical protein
MLAMAASVGLKAAMFATGAVALVASLPLILVRGIYNRAPAMHVAGAVDGKQGLTSVLTPTIIFLTGFFVLLSLSGSGISNFSVVALGSAFGTPLAAASWLRSGCSQEPRRGMQDDAETRLRARQSAAG